MNHSAPPNDTPQSDWAPCARGELVGLNARLRGSQAKRTRARVAGGVAAFAAAVLAFAFLPGLGSAPSPAMGGISCQECLAAMPAYHDQLVADAGGDLTVEQSRAIAAHLEACPLCRGHFERAYPGALSAAGVATLGWLALTTTRRRGQPRG